MIKSAGGVIYYINKANKEPKFLILKRHSLSGKIEWVAPKGKIKLTETPAEAALREVSEETGIPKNLLKNEGFLGSVSINLENKDQKKFNKSIDYFLFRFIGNPYKLKIPHSEGYLGVYKRGTIDEVLKLIYYPALRDIFYKAYKKITQQK